MFHLTVKTVLRRTSDGISKQRPNSFISMVSLWVTKNQIDLKRKISHDFEYLNSFLVTTY